MSDDHEALARTALLIRMDALDGRPADDRAIVEGLRATTARIITDHANLRSHAGQTALITLHNQLIMTGLRIDLDMPDITLELPQPPLHGASLAAALADYADDLIPGGSTTDATRPDITFALGDTPARADVRVSGSGYRICVGPDSPEGHLRWEGSNPLGAIASAAAAAAEGVRAAMLNIVARLDRDASVQRVWSRDPRRQVDHDLSSFAPHGPTLRSADLGALDMVSGGAITQACLYVLLRLPGHSGQVRVIEPETLDLNNLNRYSLARRSDLGRFKTDILTGLAGDSLTITGDQRRFDQQSAADLVPFAPAILVGVDHIPSRWLTQQHGQRQRLAIGSTSHDFVLVSSHPPGQPCAGCTHTRDDTTMGPIPTIGFVSLWAGLIQALHLLQKPPVSLSTATWPLGLDNARSIYSYNQARSPNCPLNCAKASRLSTAERICESLTYTQSTQ